MSTRASKRKPAGRKAGGGVKIPFLDLSDDEIVRVLSLLWYKDLLHVVSLSHRLRGLVQGNNTLMKALFVNQIERSKWTNFQGDQFCKSLSSKDILALASRLPNWPTDIDTTDLRYELAEVFVEGQSSKCVTYAGSVLGKNRSFVANHHFPVFGGKQDGGLETFSDFPFTKPVYDTSLQSTIPILSGIAYFEITIHKAFRQPSAVAPEGYAPCVAIGIANHRHRLNKMPGWDPNSYGFHGDDGCFFRRYPDEGVEISEEAQFGEGDTVGFGIIYRRLKAHFHDEEGPPTPQELFLTVNGKFISRYLFTSSAFDQCTWFPCVGTDCHCPIEMNFGNKGVPFIFDVVQFEKDELKPPPARKSKGKGKGKKKAVAAPAAPPVPGLADVPSLSFRAPYHPENQLQGGLYRNKEFWRRAKEHVLGNNTCDYSMSEDSHTLGSFGEDDDLGTDDTGGSGDEGEDGSDEGSDGSGGFDEFEEGEEGNESSDVDSIASESSGSLMPTDMDCW